MSRTGWEPRWMKARICLDGGPHCGPPPHPTDHDVDGTGWTPGLITSHGPGWTPGPDSLSLEMADPLEQPLEGGARRTPIGPRRLRPEENLKRPVTAAPNRRPAQVGNRRRTWQERASNEPGAELIYTCGSSWTRRGDGHAETPPVAQGWTGTQKVGPSTRIGHKRLNRHGRDMVRSHRASTEFADATQSQRLEETRRGRKPELNRYG